MRLRSLKTTARNAHPARHSVRVSAICVPDSIAADILGDYRRALGGGNRGCADALTPRTGAVGRTGVSRRSRARRYRRARPGDGRGTRR